VDERQKQQSVAAEPDAFKPAPMPSAQRLTRRIPHALSGVIRRTLERRLADQAKHRLYGG
jgi:hypothetical protein